MSTMKSNGVPKKIEESEEFEQTDQVEVEAIQDETSEIVSPSFVRGALLAVSAISIVFLVGAPLGWGPMQLLLEGNGSYSGQCINEIEPDQVCDSQTDKLLRIALVNSLTKLTAPFSGRLLDAIGAPKTSAVMSAFVLTGMGLVAWAIQAESVEFLLYVGFPLTCVGTWMGSLLIVQLGFYFRGHSASRVICVLNSLFDTGAMTYWILWVIHDQSNVSLIGLWSGYIVFAFAINAVLVFLWHIAIPQEPDEKEIEAEESHQEFRASLRKSVATMFFDYSRHDMKHTGITESKRLSRVLHLSVRHEYYSESKKNESIRRSWHPSSGFNPAAHDDKGRAASAGAARSRSLYFVPGRQVEEKEELNKIDSDILNQSDKIKEEDAPEEEKSLYEQLTPIPFIYLCIFFSFHVAAVDWNFATQRDFLAYLGDDDNGNRYLSIFSLMTPVSLLGTPFVDQFILRYGWAASFQGINFLALIYTTLKIVTENLDAQIVGFIFFSFYRSFLFGISFSFLPHVVEGPVIGTAAGIMTSLPSVLGLALIPLASLTLNQLDSNFFWPNVAFVALNIPCILIIWALVRHLEASKNQNVAAMM